MRNLTIAVLLRLFAVARAGDWETGGGDAARSGLATVAGPDAPTVLWQGSLFSSYGQQVYLWDDKLVTYRYDFTNGPLVCHDLATGDTLWTRDLGAPGGRTLPVGFRDGRVYAVALEGAYPDTLYALDADDGAILWTARLQAHMYISESVSFADNGDLIVSCGDFVTARVNCLDGDTVWTTPRTWPVSGSADLTVAGGSFYGFAGALVGGRLKVCSWDIATGRLRDSAYVEDTHPGGSAPYGNIIVGPDGVLYAHRCADNVTAIEDHGESLHVRWVHEVSDDPFAPWAQLACGPDSSVYALSSGRVVRLDPATGVALDSSPVIKAPEAVFAAHLAVGADGTVYATNGGYAGGALFAFTPDLSVLWVESIPNVSTSNPAIGRNGELAVAGGGTTLVVWQTASAVAERPGAATLGLRVCPSPVRGRARFEFTLARPADVRVEVYTADGRRVARLAPGRLAAGRQSLALPEGLAAGGYLCRLTTSSGAAATSFVRAR